ncbi:hypothetical protein [Catellatospora chokoriensis]|uniref:Uncharacterized protein n=1 Tax=Catellatospora chokoriensis TaxID=310353 RepID=A0A8J3K726_9ACTN|nr:hypothetical protein [Catellatospora chokoriensis]GIF94351.1 hypothetical protein Cch02nite_77950 [Catellatospora chokoriensis]
MAEQRGEDEALVGQHLAALADHGARIGRLAPTDQVRRRGERRRRHTRLATVAGGVAVVAVFAGVYVTQRGLGTTDVPVGTETRPPSASSTPAVTVTPKVDPSAVGGTGVPARDQAVWLQATTTSGYPLLTALPDNVVSAVGEDAATEQALFALVPTTPGAKEYQLKTGTAGSFGEPGCVTSDGDRFTVEACDASRGEQRVVLRGQAAPYEVVVNGRALKINTGGVSAVAPGQGSPLTFIVRGQAQGTVG